MRLFLCLLLISALPLLTLGAQTNQATEKSLDKARVIELHQAISDKKEAYKMAQKIEAKASAITETSKTSSEPNVLNKALNAIIGLFR